MNKKLLQQALDALLGYKQQSLTHEKEQGSAIISLREAIAQPVQPVPIALAFPHSADFSETTCPACDRKFYVGREADDEARPNTTITQPVQTTKTALNVAMATLNQIVLTPRNKGARQRAYSTVKFLETQLNGIQVAGS